MTTILLDDKKTYAMLARGEAMGVFQFESSGMREALRQVKPLTVFEDLIALVALLPPPARCSTSRTTPSGRRGRSRSRSSTRG